jgi:hypothetical protein
MLLKDELLAIIGPLPEKALSGLPPRWKHGLRYILERYRTQLRREEQAKALRSRKVGKLVSTEPAVMDSAPVTELPAAAESPLER